MRQRLENVEKQTRDSGKGMLIEEEQMRGRVR
jgi:hypothetical protein